MNPSEAATTVVLVLLGTGPIVGLCWAATLVKSHVWTWPVPTVLPVAVGATLAAIVASLVLAATARTSLRRTRIAAGAGVALAVLDATILGTLALVAPPLVRPMIPAVAASLARVALTARAIPRLLR